MGLLKENRAVSQQASARIKLWSLFLSSYDYQLVLCNTKAHANTNALSRLPLPEEPLKTVVLLAEHLAESPVTAHDIQACTRRDSKLLRVLHHVQKRWPIEGDPELEPYSLCWFELSSYEGCIMLGSRIIVPPPGRQTVLQELMNAILRFHG